MTAPGIVDAMRALVLEPDAHFLAWLDDRRRRGVDRFDEVWDGVLHVVPFPGFDHQDFEGELEVVLRRVTAATNLKVLHNFGVYDPIKGEKNLRGPDVLVAALSHISQRGVEGRAELVVEILSPNDESRDKFGFYAGCGIPEFWIIHPVTRVAEVYVLDHGTYVDQPVAPDGTIEAPRLGLTLRVVDGPKLRITWADGSAEI